MMEIPRMRTINAAYDWIMEHDAQTNLTRNAFRKLVSNGKIPSIKVGNRFLVNVDIIFSVLEREMCIQNEQ